MKRWSEFAAEQPDMAEAGRALIYQFRVGLGYLATVRKDGGPRVHPVCPVIAHDGIHGHGRLHQQRHAVRALARARPACQIWAAAELAAGVY